MPYQPGPFARVGEQANGHASDPEMPHLSNKYKLVIVEADAWVLRARALRRERDDLITSLEALSVAEQQTPEVQELLATLRAAMP